MQRSLMKVQKPQFIEGIQWRKLSASERNGRPWKYELIEGVAVKFKEMICVESCYLLDGDGMCWGSITPHQITVSRNYQWNGSSCSPDLHGVLLSSVVHDLLYQFSGAPRFPLSRKFADDLFYSLATSRLAFLYRAGLLVGGWTCWGQHEPGAHIISP